MRILVLILICLGCHTSEAVKQKYADNATVNNHLIWPTMGPMAKEKLHAAVDQGAISMVISTNEMQRLIDVTGKQFVRVTMNGVSRAKILHAIVKNWMDTIIHLKNYTTTLRKSDAYFDEKEQAFDLYLAQLKDLSKYLKKVRYNAEFVAGFLYKLYDFDRLTFGQMGQFVDLLKSKYSSKSGDTDLDQILEDYIESVSKADDSYDDIDDGL